MTRRRATFAILATLGLAGCVYHQLEYDDPPCPPVPPSRGAILSAGVDTAPLAVFGHVTLLDNGEPVPGVAVSVEGLGRVDTTDNAGVFRLDSMPSGEWIMRSSRLGFKRRRDSLRTDGRGVDVRIVLEREVLDACPGFAEFKSRRHWRWPWSKGKI